MNKNTRWILYSALSALLFVGLAIYSKNRIRKNTQIVPIAQEETTPVAPQPVPTNNLAQPPAAAAPTTPSLPSQKFSLTESLRERDDFLKRHKLQWTFPIRVYGMAKKDPKTNVERLMVSNPNAGYYYSLALIPGKKVHQFKNQIMEMTKLTEDDIKVIKIKSGSDSDMRVLEAYEYETGNYTTQRVLLEHPFTGQQFIALYRGKFFNRTHQEFANQIFQNLKPLR